MADVEYYGDGVSLRADLSNATMCAVQQMEHVVHSFVRELEARHAIAADIERAAFSEHNALSEQTMRLYLSAWLLQPYVEEELFDVMCSAAKLDYGAWV